MNCPACGLPLDQGAEFCGNCGHALADQPEPKPVAATPVPTTGDPRSNRLATAALLLGIIGLPASMVWLLGLPANIIALTLGISGVKSQKRGRAIAGLVLASVGLTLTIVIVLIEMLARPDAVGDPGGF